MARAGRLRESVTFQRQGAGAATTLRNQSTDFADITGATAIPADITPLRHGETVLAEGVQGRRIFRVVVRYTDTLASISVNDRMVDARDSSRVFNIKAPPVNHDRKRQMLDILVEQGGANG
jgi:head-tail adaptor